MTPSKNRQIILKTRPHGIPQAEHFEIITSAIPELKQGEFLVKNEFLSVEPAMRGWVNIVANYSDPVGLGEVMRAFSAGTVIASKHPGYAEGDRVMGMLGWQEYSVTDGKPVRRKVKEDDLSLSLSLGILGINGVTAYFALTEIGAPKAGETVVVSAAGGAVGSAVGQIAKVLGCRTVGIDGGANKIKSCIEEFDFDAAIDYQSPNFAAEIAAACKTGVDIYHDGVSGTITDTVVQHINKGARIIVCGTIAIESWDPWPSGPRIERHLLNKAAKMQGFLIWDYEHRYEEAVEKLAGWIREGRLHFREDILDGIEHAPGSIADLYRGTNTGKRLIRLATD